MTSKPATLRLPDVAVPLLHPTIGKVFNRAWYRINTPGEHLESIGAFFHPLDAVANWNLLYGRHGFIQWQIAVPDQHAAMIEHALEQLAAIGAGSFLSILKRFGPANDGPLSFPIGGWTLAVDIPPACAAWPARCRSSTVERPTSVDVSTSPRMLASTPGWFRPCTPASTSGARSEMRWIPTTSSPRICRGDSD